MASWFVRDRPGESSTEPLRLVADDSVTPGVATPPAPTPTPTFEERIEHAMRFRRNAGLPWDRETVLARENDPTAIKDAGIPMTWEEFGVFERLMSTVTDNIIEMTDAMQRDPGYAGHWVEPAEGYRLVVATTSEPAVMERELAGYRERGVKLHVVRHKYTYSELRALQEEIGAAIDEWQAKGVRIAAIGVDVKGNRTEVAVVKLTPEQARALHAAYGPRLVAHRVNSYGCRPIGIGPTRIEFDADGTAYGVGTSDSLRRRIVWGEDITVSREGGTWVARGRDGRVIARDGEELELNNDLCFHPAEATLGIDDMR